MVDSQLAAQQQQTNHYASPRSDNNVRCIKDQMGGNLQHYSDRGAVECRRKWPAHKYLGINGGEFSSVNILQKQKQHSCTLNDGQYTSSLLHIKNGKDKECNPLRNSQGSWDFCLPKEILLTGEYLPGILNNSSSVWRLNPAVFTWLQKLKWI